MAKKKKEVKTYRVSVRRTVVTEYFTEVDACDEEGAKAIAEAEANSTTHGWIEQSIEDEEVTAEEAR